MASITLDSGLKIPIPMYDNLEKIGSKEKLKNYLNDLEEQDYSLSEIEIFRIGRTYFVYLT